MASAVKIRLGECAGADMYEPFYYFVTFPFSLFYSFYSRCQRIYEFRAVFQPKNATCNATLFQIFFVVNFYKFTRKGSGKFVSSTYTSHPRAICA